MGFEPALISKGHRGCWEKAFFKLKRGLGAQDGPSLLCGIVGLSVVLGVTVTTLSRGKEIQREFSQGDLEL
jgi:hypothetical protein